MLTVDWLITR